MGILENMEIGGIELSQSGKGIEQYPHRKDHKRVTREIITGAKAGHPGRVADPVPFAAQHPPAEQARAFRAPLHSELSLSL